MQLGIASVAGAEFVEEYMARGRTLATEGRPEEATVAFREALRVSPDLAEAAYMLAVIHEKRGELESAVTAYRETIRLQPKTPDAHFYLGVLLDKIGDKRSSAVALLKANDLTADSDHREANYWLAAVLEDLGDSQGAFDAYKDTYQIAHRFQPGTMMGHSDIEEIRHMEDAIHQFRVTLGVRLDIVDIANRVGLMLSRRGNYTRALLELNTALREDRNNLRTLNNMGLTYGRSGDFNRGVAEFKKILELSPDYLPARANLARALERTGDANGAAEQYRRLAETYHGEGKSAESVQMYRKYLQTLPDVPANLEQRRAVEKVLHELERMER